MLDARIVTYNVLSTGLTKGHGCEREPVVLNEGARWKLLSQQIRSMAAQSPPPIFCLQEVSHLWHKKLSTLFVKLHYGWHFSGYGEDWGGRMGVGVAYPHSHYDIESLDIVRVGAVIPARQKPPTPPPSTALIPTAVTTAASSAVAAVRSYFKAFKYVPAILKPPPRPPLTALDNWDSAVTRKNEMVVATLKDKATAAVFVAASYHFPCAFRFPLTMALHGFASMKILNDIAAAAAAGVAYEAIEACTVPLQTSSTVNTPLWTTLDVAPSRRSFVPVFFGSDTNTQPDNGVYNLFTTATVGAVGDMIAAPLREVASYVKSMGGGPCAAVADVRRSSACGTSKSCAAPQPFEQFGVFARLVEDAVAGGPFVSAAAVAQGREHEHTTSALHNIFSVVPERFVAALDYVFVRGMVRDGAVVGDVTACESVAVPAQASLPPPQAVPNKEWPSDHFPVGARVRVPV